MVWKARSIKGFKGLVAEEILGGNTCTVLQSQLNMWLNIVGQ